MKIRPLGDHVVVQVVEEEKTTASGIVLPDTVDKKEKAQGKVMAIGTGKMLKDGSRAAIEVKVGDVVLFKKWGGDEVAKVVRATLVATLFDHGVQAAGSEVGELLECLQNEGQIGINVGAAYRPHAGQPLLAQDALDGAMVDVQLGSNGAGAPKLN